MWPNLYSFFRETETDRERDRERQTDRERERQTERDRDRDRERAGNQLCDRGSLYVDVALADLFNDLL